MKCECGSEQAINLVMVAVAGAKPVTEDSEGYFGLAPGEKMPHKR